MVRLSGAMVTLIGALIFACVGACVVHGAIAQQTITTRTLAPTEAGTILCRSVFDSTGEDVGPLVDVMVDTSGVPAAGGVAAGGFLGVGTRRVAVAWHLLRFEHDADETRVQMDLTFDSAAAAPEYQGPDNTLIVIDRAAP